MARRSPGTELDPLVNQYQHESHRKRATEAFTSLRKIASIVKPIMRQRNWTVGTLAEFYPPETNLLGLNVNRGEKICLRLRYPGDENQFLPIEQVVDTMLHELCHIVHGPHNEQFHALWNQLRDEHEALMRKGYTGEGFLGRGSRLGGARIPMAEARRVARAAAEQRRNRGAGSGQKLGGNPVVRGQDIRQVIADAAQRRIAIMKGCANGTEKGREIEQEEQSPKVGVTTTQAEQDDANESMMMQAYIDLIQEEEKQKYGDFYSPPSESNPAGMRAAAAPPLSPKSLVSQQADIERSLPKTNAPPAVPTDTKPPRQSYNPRAASTHHDVPDTWTCDICTLINPMQFLICDACSTERPPIFSNQEQSYQPPAGRPPQSRPGGSAPERHSAFQPRLKVADSLAKIKAQEESRKAARPMAWMCSRCGSYTEAEWWTCTNCGTMKDSS